jgi:hypothetical protein
MAPIHEAAFVGNLNRVRALLNQGVPVNTRDAHGWTPLHWAAKRGQLNVVHELLRRGARVNSRSNYGRTPLHIAAIYGPSRVVHELLKAGANPEYKNVRGNTPYKRTFLTSARNALKTSRPASKWLETTRKRKLERQKVASLVAMSPLPLNIKRRILSNAGLKKKSPVKK